MALYPAMRFFGRFDFDRYLEEAEVEAEVSEFDEIYRDRQFDFCKADRNILAEFAGISKRSMKSALDTLEDKDLISEISPGVWKVFIVPAHPSIISDLNQKIIDRYRHEKNRQRETPVVENLPPVNRWPYKLS